MTFIVHDNDKIQDALQVKRCLFDFQSYCIRHSKCHSICEEDLGRRGNRLYVPAMVLSILGGATNLSVASADIKAYVSIPFAVLSLAAGVLFGIYEHYGFSRRQTSHGHYAAQYYKLYNDLRTHTVLGNVHDGEHAVYKNPYELLKTAAARINALRDLAPPLDDATMRAYYRIYDGFLETQYERKLAELQRDLDYRERERKLLRSRPDSAADDASVPSAYRQGAQSSERPRTEEREDEQTRIRTLEEQVFSQARDLQRDREELKKQEQRLEDEVHKLYAFHNVCMSPAAPPPGSSASFVSPDEEERRWMRSYQNNFPILQNDIQREVTRYQENVIEGERRRRKDVTGREQKTEPERAPSRASSQPGQPSQQHVRRSDEAPSSFGRPCFSENSERFQHSTSMALSTADSFPGGLHFPENIVESTRNDDDPTKDSGDIEEGRRI